MDNRPIGVFDSGLGGLTVVKALKELLPNESIVYFGDTARLPYGVKSQGLVKQYSKEIIKFLLEKNVSAENGPLIFILFFNKNLIAGLIIFSSALNFSIDSQ